MSEDISSAIREGIEIDIKYQGYLKRQRNNIAQIERQRLKRLSKQINYSKIETLSLEAREKLNLFNSPKILWEETSSIFLDKNKYPESPGAWKLMLLGDGSPTRHLQLLTKKETKIELIGMNYDCLLYTSPSPRDSDTSRMPSSA